MAKHNITKYMILGILTTWGPMSGYDLANEVKSSVGNFWKGSYGQIYPTLKALAQGGLVTKRIKQQVGKPNRHLYKVTAAGQQELQSWLTQPIGEERYSSAYVLTRIFFGRLTKPEVNVKLVEQLRAHLVESRERLNALVERLERQHAGNPDLPYWLMTIRLSQRIDQATLDWCDETLAALTDLARKRPTRSRTIRKLRSRAQ